MATRQDVREAAELRLGDTGNSIWSDAELNVYITEGQEDLVRRTGALWIKASPAGLVPAASDGTYTLPTDLVQLERITYQRMRMFPLTRREAEMRDPRYRDTEGEPRFYLMEGDGYGVIRYIQVPSANGANDDISIEYQRKAAALSTDGTSLDIPDRYCDYVRHFVMWKAYEREGPGQNLKVADHYRLRYEDGIRRILRRKSQIHHTKINSLHPIPPRNIMGMPMLPWNYGQRVR